MQPSDVENHVRVSSLPELVYRPPAADNSRRRPVAVEVNPRREPRSPAKTCLLYPRGSWLFAQGSVANGVFVLHSGYVKETISSADGRRLIVRVAGPGEFVGLTAVLTGRNYDSTAEVLETTQAQFMPSEDFLRSMEDSGRFCIGVVTQLGRNCMDVYRHLRRITFPTNVTQRVAFLVQEWCAGLDAPPAGAPLRLKVVLTQEEIAQMVDSTRETVSRVLMDLRRRGWLRIKGVSWTITNPAAMKELAEWGSTSRS